MGQASLCPPSGADLYPRTPGTPITNMYVHFKVCDNDATVPVRMTTVLHCDETRQSGWGSCRASMTTHWPAFGTTRAIPCLSVFEPHRLVTLILREPMRDWTPPYYGCAKKDSCDKSPRSPSH